LLTLKACWHQKLPTATAQLLPLPAFLPWHLSCRVAIFLLQALLLYHYCSSMPRSSAPKVSFRRALRLTLRSSRICSMLYEQSRDYSAIRLDRVKEEEEDVVAGPRCQRRGVEGEVSKARCRRRGVEGEVSRVRVSGSKVSVW
jgi:hypothetical protein